jgi:hypothetical protein
VAKASNVRTGLRNQRWPETHGTVVGTCAAKYIHAAAITGAEPHRHRHTLSRVHMPSHYTTHWRSVVSWIKVGNTVPAAPTTQLRPVLRQPYTGHLARYMVRYMVNGNRSEAVRYRNKGAGIQVRHRQHVEQTQRFLWMVNS